jgi:hypothetical protein
MAIPVTPGPVNVVVKWTTLPDVIAGRLVSALALALLIALYFLERRFALSGATETRAGTSAAGKTKAGRSR